MPKKKLTLSDRKRLIIDWIERCQNETTIASIESHMIKLCADALRE